MSFAQTLGRQGMRVLYCTNYRSNATKSSKALSGERMDYITRVDSFWDHLDEADVVVFPFLGDGDLQEYLVEKGKAVWGNRRAELLELDRVGFRKVIGALGLDVADADRIEGLDALEEYLKDPENDDRFLKASWFRGDMETHHHQSWKLSETWFRGKQLQLGPYGREIVVIAEPKIEGCEPGWDGGYVVDGEMPASPVWGYEKKNSCYAGTHFRCPKIIMRLADALSEPLRSLGARGNFHFECRITDSAEAYLTDPTIRMASPAGEALCRMIENWPEIVWHGARGEFVEPEYAAKWVAQIVLKSQWSAENYMSVYVPPEHRDNVFFHSAMGYDDCVAVMPGEDEIFGSAVYLGATLEEATTGAEKIAESIEGYQVDYNRYALRDLRECFDGLPGLDYLED